jgi:hypothetical protein
MQANPFVQLVGVHPGLQGKRGQRCARLEAGIDQPFLVYRVEASLAPDTNTRHAQW